MDPPQTGTPLLGGEHAELLSQVELFRGLDRVTLAKLAAYLEPIQKKAGEVVFRKGDPPDGLYLVSRGCFVIFSGNNPSDEVVFNVLRRGEAFGEIALLTGEMRTASARADDDGELLRLDQTRFRQLVRGDPSVTLAISAGLIRRLRVADAARLGVPVEFEEREDIPTPRQTEAVIQRGRWQSHRTLGLILGGLVLVAGWVAPPPRDLSAAGWHALASLIALVPLLAFEALSDGATSLLLILVWVVGGVVPARSALSGFATTTWILTVSVFAVGGAVAASGLLYRLALWAVARAADFRAQVAALGLGGLVLSAAVPNATGRMSLIASAVAELGEALGYRAGTHAAAGLAMASFVGFGIMVAPFLTSSSTALLSFALLPESSRAGLNWVTWSLRAAPLHLVLLVGLLGFVLWRYAPDKTTGDEQLSQEPSVAVRVPSAALNVQQALLGRLSPHERIAGVVTASLLIGFATQPLHGVDPAWVSVAAFVVMAGLGVLTLDTLRSVNWNTVLLLGVLASMADVVSTTRLDAWLSSVLVGVVSRLGAAPVLFVGGLALLCLALSLVLRWQASVPLIVLALGPVAQSAGIDPWVVAMVALTACNTFFLPYQSTIYLALYTGGGSKLFNHRQVRPLSFAYAVLTVAGLLASIPIWHAMGLV